MDIVRVGLNLSFFYFLFSIPYSLEFMVRGRLGWSLNWTGLDLRSDFVRWLLTYYLLQYLGQARLGLCVKASEFKN